MYDASHDIMTVFGYPKAAPADVLRDRSLERVVRAVFSSVLSVCGVGGVDKVIDAAFACARRGARTEQIEKTVRGLLRKLIDARALRTALDERARLIADQIEPYLVGKRVLDIGCGDGMIGEALVNRGWIVRMVDVKNYVDPRVRVPVQLISENEPLPFNCKEFDVVLLLTVLHHAEAPLELLKEAVRLTARRLIVIESVFGVVPEQDSKPSPLHALNVVQQRSYAIIVDWVYNRLLHEDVLVPYNFFVPLGWKALLELAGLRILTIGDLGIDQPLVPEHHVLYVADRH
jgi:SAM-dependent methyltransferase